MNDSGKAAKWLIILSTYFVALFFIFSLASSFTTDYDLSLDNVSYSGGSNTISGQTNAYCTGPRFDDNTDNNEISAAPLVKHGYITDEASCNDYEGLYWENETTFFFGLFNSASGCFGNLNVTHYNDGVEYTGTTYLNRILSDPLNDLTLVNSSQGVCELLGFKWSTASTRLTDAKTTTAIGLLVDVATFDVSISTSYPILNVLFSFLVIWLPLILMIISAYMLTPLA